MKNTLASTYARHITSTGSKPTTQPPTQPTGRANILYVLPHTKGFAGIERVVDDVCSMLASKYGHRFDITVLATSTHGGHHFEDRPYRLIKAHANNRWQLLRNVRRVVSSSHYDLVVVPQVEPTVAYWLACVGIPTQFAMHLHGNPARERSHWKAKVLFALLDKLVLHRLTCIFGTSPQQLSAFESMFPSAVPRRWVPNPVRKFADDTTPESGSPHGRTTFVNVGRFHRQKGQDILLKAFAQLLTKRPNSVLKLVGFGAEEANLKQLAHDLGVADAVSFEYHPKNPQAALASSDVYVSASRWEGWSLAICEALRMGLPVVSTDCEFGPRDILTDHRLGRLVPMKTEDDLAGDLADAMLCYYDNLEQEQQHGAYRKEYVDKFSAEEVVHTHAQALLQGLALA